MSVENTASSKPHIHIAPSVMCADLCNLEADIRELETAGIDMLHFDLMDAHFRPEYAHRARTYSTIARKNRVCF